MKILVLNQKNIVPDGQNNKLVYNFPNSVQFKDCYVAISSVSMYYSWFNITSAYVNNIFTYSWTQAGGFYYLYSNYSRWNIRSSHN